MRFSRCALWMAVGIGLSLGACSCDEDPLTPQTPGTCEPEFECPTGHEYRLGQCKAARCGGDIECCPGQKCNTASGLCITLLENQECETDDTCQIAGQRCISMKGGRYCGYPNKNRTTNAAGGQACSSSADCDIDRSCFGSRCVTAAPCDGGCPAGFVCDVDTNSCYAMPNCKEQCATGQMLTLSNPDTMSGPQCCEIACQCETLPPVALGQFGWYASLAKRGEALLVSAYDPGYGDLVVASYDLDGATKQVEYVDGFDTSGAVVGDPNGRRRGRNEPGPDVGMHTSMAVDANGAVHVAYYDRDLGALRYANNTAGVWATTLVDDEGDTGGYTSISIAPDGFVRIAYMMMNGTVAPDPTRMTALKLATARSNLPTQTSDWTTVAVDARPIPAATCYSGCPSTMSCVDLGAEPVCAPLANTCGTCTSSSVCVDVNGIAKCKAHVDLVPVDDLVAGTGLFASLAFTSTGTALIAYYDSVDGDLRLATDDGRGGFLRRTLAGNVSAAPSDEGQHLSLAVGPGDIVGVAFMDSTRDDLVYLELPRGAREIVDNGVSPPDLRMVGADASLLFDSFGQPAIAYQDPTRIDLLYARRVQGVWTKEILVGAPASPEQKGTASGFYVDQLRQGDDAWILGVDVGFTPESRLLLTPRIFKKRLD